MLVRDEIKREDLPTILLGAPLMPLQAYLATAERPDTYHNLPILALISNH
jgi:hypothetical protein